MSAHPTGPTRQPYFTGWQRVLHPAVVLPVVGVLAFALWWGVLRSDATSSARGAAGESDQVVPVEFGPLAQTVVAQGTIAAAATEGLSFAAAGTVTSVDVRAGATVTAGQVLATMESPVLQANVDAARATMLQARAKLDADTAAGASEAQLAADRSQLATSTDALTAATTAIAGTSLVATFDGVVTSVNLVTGQVLGANGGGATTMTGSDSGSGSSSANVGTGTASNAFNRNGTAAAAGSTTTSTGQINVQSTGLEKVDLQVSSSDISRVAVGQTATVAITASAAAAPGGRQQSTTTTTAPTTTAVGATAKGTVTSVGAVASATNGVATFPVTVVFPADTAKFPVGATAVTSIVVATTADVISVPTAAVSTAADGSRTVLVSNDGTATNTRIVTVTTGTTSGGRVEIRSGLTRTDRVVIPLATSGATATTVAAGAAVRGSGG